MKKVTIFIDECQVCGRMYHPNGNLVKSYQLLYLAFLTTKKNVNVKITKITCSLCKH